MNIIVRVGSFFLKKGSKIKKKAEAGTYLLHPSELFFRCDEGSQSKSGHKQRKAS